jgi:TRAF3-interacting protein 1
MTIARPPPRHFEDNNNRDRQDEKPMEDDSNALDSKGDGEVDKKSMRPTTARRRPPKIKDASREVTAKEVAPSAKKTEGIMIDGQNDDDDDEIIEDEERLADNKEDGDVDRNNPQSKLVQDIMSRQAEQEAAAKVHSNRGHDMGDEKEDKENTKTGGIRLGRLRKTGLDKKGVSGKGVSSGSDIERLRKAVQVLVQHTGPLGTCMDYIQEDVSIMTTELHRWEEDCRKYEIEVETQKKKTEEILNPLQRELDEVHLQIQEQQLKVSVTKATIAKNEARIQQILRLTATA